MHAVLSDAVAIVGPGLLIIFLQSLIVVDLMVALGLISRFVLVLLAVVFL